MKAISIPIKSHTSVRRRPSEYKAARLVIEGDIYRLAEKWLMFFDIPIVHTGTTKRKDPYLVSRVTTAEGFARLAKAFKLADGDIDTIAPIIEVHKRPNILKRTITNLKRKL